MPKQKIKQWTIQKFYMMESTKEFDNPKKVIGLVHKSGTFGIHTMSTIAHGHCVVHIPSNTLFAVCKKGKAAKSLVKALLALKIDFSFNSFAEIDKNHLIEARKLIKYWQEK
jgi:hypothetical protein